MRNETHCCTSKLISDGALPPCPRAATCPDFVGITPHPDGRDSYRIGEAGPVDLESHSERRNDNRVPFFPIEADVIRTPQLPDGRANADSFARATSGRAEVPRSRDSSRHPMAQQIRKRRSLVNPAIYNKAVL